MTGDRMEPGYGIAIMAFPSCPLDKSTEASRLAANIFRALICYKWNNGKYKKRNKILAKS